MAERDWKQADLARKTGISTGYISQILNGVRTPGTQFTKALARVFGMSDIEVMRRAGLADDLPKFSPVIEATASMLNDLPEEDQEDIRAMVRAKWERAQRKKKQVSGAKS